MYRIVTVIEAGVAQPAEESSSKNGSGLSPEDLALLKNRTVLELWDVTNERLDGTPGYSKIWVKAFSEPGSKYLSRIFYLGIPTGDQELQDVILGSLGRGKYRDCKRTEKKYQAHHYGGSQ